MLESDTIYGFFDGSEQDGNCGTGMILRIYDSHSFKLRMGVGSGNNTFSELLALWGLLWFTIYIYILYLFIFGESNVIIDWAKGLTNLQSLSYDCWLKRIGLLKNCFLSLSFGHLYREFNSDADNLSNLAIGDCLGILHLCKYSNRIMITEGRFTCF